MDMKKFYGKAFGEVMVATILPFAYALILAHVLGRPKGSLDCYGSTDIDVTIPKTTDTYTFGDYFDTFWFIEPHYVNVTL